LGFRTDVTGKVVRYLQDNGADVKVGEPFVEDDGVRQMLKDNSESLDTIITLNLAHQKLSKRASLLPSISSVYQEHVERLFKVLMNWREINPTINILKDVTLYSLPMM
jgi:hypothetical protein